MSSAIVNDFYRPLINPDCSEHGALRIAKACTVVTGFALIAVAVAVAGYYEANPKTDLLSIALGVMTLFYGGLLGIFLVGLLTKTRGDNTSNIVGLVLSTSLIILISYKQDLLPLLGLYDPVVDAGIARGLYHFKLAWPWFIIIGTAVTFAISAIGLPASNIAKSYQESTH